MNLRKILMTGLAELTLMFADYSVGNSQELPLTPLSANQTDNQYQPDPRYEAEAIHKLMGMMNFPQFPISTACIAKENKKGLFNFGKGKSYMAKVEDVEFQPAAGMGFVDTRRKLESLATGIAKCYQPKNLDPDAFEDLAVFAGIDDKFIRWVENTRNPSQPTVYDALAQFSREYQAHPGILAYHTSDGHLHATGNRELIKRLKEKKK